MVILFSLSTFELNKGSLMFFFYKWLFNTFLLIISKV